MLAIYNKDCELVGWYDSKDESSYIFDKEMNWTAFTEGSSVFNTTNLWLGAFINFTFVDKQGKALAFIEGHEPLSSFPPRSPFRPEIPKKPKRQSKPSVPAKPASHSLPVNEWSLTPWSAWITQTS